MNELQLEWDLCEAQNPSRSYSSGTEIQVCHYNLRGINIYERVYFPYSIIKPATTRWLIDYRLCSADIPLIKELGEVLEGEEIYDDTPGAVYAMFKDETNLLIFFKSRFMDKKDMTRDEAISALDNGYTVSHRLFVNGEWVKRSDKTQFRHLQDENGYEIPLSEYFGLRSGGHWETGWRII